MTVQETVADATGLTRGHRAGAPRLRMRRRGARPVGVVSPSAMPAQTTSVPTARSGWNVPLPTSTPLERVIAALLDLSPDWPQRVQGAQAMRAAGRAPQELDVASWMRTRGRPLDDVLSDIPAMRAAGVTVGEFLFAPYAETVDEVPAFLERLARALEPYRSTRT